MIISHSSGDNNSDGLYGAVINGRGRRGRGTVLLSVILYLNFWTYMALRLFYPRD